MASPPAATKRRRRLLEPVGPSFLLLRILLEDHTDLNFLCKLPPELWQELYQFRLASQWKLPPPRPPYMPCLHCPYQSECPRMVDWNPDFPGDLENQYCVSITAPDYFSVRSRFFMHCKWKIFVWGESDIWHFHIESRMFVCSCGFRFCGSPHTHWGLPCTKNLWSDAADLK